MAAVSSLGIAFTTVAGNKTVTATPALGDLIVVIAANTGRTTAQAPTITDNNTGGHGTYAQVTSATKTASVDSMWIFIRVDTITSATSTIFTLAQASDTGGGLEVFKVTGMSIAAAAAARAVGKQDNVPAATNATPAFPQAVLTTNACLGALFATANPPSYGVPTSWTQSQNTGYTIPTTGIQTAFRNSGETGTTMTWAVPNGNTCCAAVLELNTSVPQLDPLGFNLDDRDYRLQSVSRSAAW